MALQTVSANARYTKFVSDFHNEYYRENRFSKYMGAGSGNIIVTRNVPVGTERVPIIWDMQGDGVSGDQILGGNEQPLADAHMNIKPINRRQAYKVGEDQRTDTVIDLLMAGREGLMRWGKQMIRNDTMRSFMMATDANGVFYDYGKANGRNYAAATGATLDAWQADNTDRILYGAAKSNLSSGDHTASLANIDTTNDKLTANMVSIAKRMAQTATPKVSPIRTEGDKEWYICFHDPYAFRNIRNDSTITQAQREVAGQGAPLFDGGQFVYDGVIHIEVPELAEFIDLAADAANQNAGYWGAAATADSLLTAGNGSSRVGVSFLCGAQAICYAERRTIIFPELVDTDYGFFKGYALDAFHTFQKYFFNYYGDYKQIGMVTIFSSAAVDA